MSDAGGIWQVLGIEETRDVGAIRRAYADRLRENPPETDAESFQRLRGAYERALARARGPGRFVPAGQPFLPPSRMFAPPGTLDVPPPPVAARRATAPLPVPLEPQPRNVDLDLERDRAALREAFRHLKALLSQQAPVTGAELTSALDAVLDSPGVFQVGYWATFEATLANMLLGHTPRSNAILARAVQRLGWSRNDVGSSRAAAIIAVVNRLEDVRAVERLRRASGDTALALELLSRALPDTAPKRWWYGFTHGPLVRRFMRQRFEDRPTIAELLDSATVAWWRDYLQRPQLGLRPVLVGLVVTIYAVALASLLMRAGAATVGDRLLWTAAAAGSGIAVAGGWLYLITWPRWLLRPRGPAEGGFWRHLGWLPAAIGLVLIGLALPRGTISNVAVTAAGAALCVWASAAAIRQGADDMRSARVAVAAILASNLGAVIWATVASLVAPPALAIAIDGAIVAVLIGAPTLQSAWNFALSLRMRQATLLGLNGLGLMTLLVLWSAGRADYSLPAAAVLVTVMILLSRTIRWSFGVRLKGVGTAAMWIAIALARTIGVALSSAGFDVLDLTRALAALITLAICARAVVLLVADIRAKLGLLRAEV